MDCLPAGRQETADRNSGGVGWSAEPSRSTPGGDWACLPRADLPPYSPELNPAERVFLEEVRRWIEGKVYQRMEDKVAAVAAYLTEFESDPNRVRALAGWRWIDEAAEHLPTLLAV